MAEALNNVYEAPICVEPQLLKSCLKPPSATQEPRNCSLVAVIYNTFSCQIPPHKTPNELPKYVHFRLSSYD